MTPDAINGLFTIGGALAIGTSIYKLHKDKKVQGVYWPMLTFFICWSSWNIYFYSHLNQWISVLCGLCILASETVYMVMLIYYGRTK